jgi:hypothetical protein
MRRGHKSAPGAAEAAAAAKVAAEAVAAMVVAGVGDGIREAAAEAAGVAAAATGSTFSLLLTSLRCHFDWIPAVACVPASNQIYCETCPRGAVLNRTWRLFAPVNYKISHVSF